MKNNLSIIESAKNFFSNDNLYIYESKKDVAAVIGLEISKNLELNPKEKLGLIAGESITPIYEKIVNQVSQSGISLNKTKVFLTADFLNLANPESSLTANIKQNFLDRTNISHKNVFIPSLNKIYNYKAFAPEEFHQQLVHHGSIDSQLLWIGENGQLAFNEPNNNLDSINNFTNIVNLSNSSQKNIEKYFKKDLIIPSQAITMGLVEIIYAKKIYLPIYGVAKINALIKLFQAKDFDPNWPITALIYAQGKVKIYLDDATSQVFFSKLKNKNL